MRELPLYCSVLSLNSSGRSPHSALHATLQVWSASATPYEDWSSEPPKDSNFKVRRHALASHTQALFFLAAF